VHGWCCRRRVHFGSLQGRKTVLVHTHPLLLSGPLVCLQLYCLYVSACYVVVCVGCDVVCGVCCAQPHKLVSLSSTGLKQTLALHVHHSIRPDWHAAASFERLVLFCTLAHHSAAVVRSRTSWGPGC
jgi:hypothetical protein